MIFGKQFGLESWVKFWNTGTMSFLIGKRPMCLKCLQWFKSRFGLGFILSLVLGCFLFLIGVWIRWLVRDWLFDFLCEYLMLVLWSCLFGRCFLGENKSLKCCLYKGWTISEIIYFYFLILFLIKSQIFY